MNAVELEVSSTTVDRVRAWISAKRSLARAESETEKARKNLTGAERELGDWICPDDRLPHEVFNIWYGNGVLQVQLVDAMENRYEIHWRKEPQGKQLAEEGS